VGRLMIFVEMSIGTSPSNRALSTRRDYSTGMLVDARWNVQVHHPNRTTTSFTQYVQNISYNKYVIHTACSHIVREAEMEKEIKERPRKQNSDLLTAGNE
jgi:hypothetical protein